VKPCALPTKYSPGPEFEEKAMKVSQKMWVARLIRLSEKNQLPRGFKMAPMKVINYVQSKTVSNAAQVEQPK